MRTLLETVPFAFIAALLVEPTVSPLCCLAVDGILLNAVLRTPLRPIILTPKLSEEQTAAMFLQKLTKSYSNSLPVYEPIPSDDFPHADHDAGSFTCTYSPQHSVGVARVVVQSAQLRKPRGFKKWFRMKPSVWVRVKILGRTQGTVASSSSKEGGGKIHSWREERVVGQTDVSNRTFTPNFGFKSYYTLLGPYEKHIELEVRNKRSWHWPFSGRSSAGLLGIANFLLPESHSHAEPLPGTSTTHLGESESLMTRPSQSTIRSNSPSHTVTQDLAGGTNEWTVQAPLFNGDMSKIEGYLLFNVFWYPVVLAPLPAPISEPWYRPHEQQAGPGYEVTPQPQAPGIATFTLHSLEDLAFLPDQQIMVTVSLGWRLPPLHISWMTKGSNVVPSNSSTESDGQCRGEETQHHPDQTIFDSTFEFLCLDAYSTNVVVKVYEVNRGNLLSDLGRTKKELVGHASVPILDLIGKQHNADIGVGLDGEGRTDDDFGLNFDLQSILERRRRRGGVGDGQDRVLPLLGHPTGKTRVCVEWRSLKIPDVHAPRAKCYD